MLLENKRALLAIPMANRRAAPRPAGLSTLISLSHLALHYYYYYYYYYHSSRARSSSRTGWPQQPAVLARPQLLRCVSICDVVVNGGAWLRRSYIIIAELLRFRRSWE